LIVDSRQSALAVTSLRKMSKVLLSFFGEWSIAVTRQGEWAFYELSKHGLTPLQREMKISPV
jgi:hypothetical protein